MYRMHEINIAASLSLLLCNAVMAARPLAEITADIVAVRFPSAAAASDAAAGLRLAELTREAFEAMSGKPAATDADLTRIGRSVMTKAWQQMPPPDAANQVDGILAGGRPAFLVPVARVFKVGSLLRGVPTKQATYADAKTAVDALIAATPKDASAVTSLAQLARFAPDEAARSAIEKQIVASYPDSADAARLRGEALQKKAIGKPFDLAFKDFRTGQPVSLQADFKGKIVIVDFWATWCAPCVAELPRLRELQAKYKDQNVAIIGVSCDLAADEGGPDRLKQFLAANDVPWPQFYQGNGVESAFSAGWSVTELPAMFVIDADGNLASHQGREQLETLIPQLIKKRDGN